VAWILPLLFGAQGAVACDVAINLGEPVSPVIKPYPRELEETVVLKSGREVLLRPIRAEDEPRHLEFHESQSPETIRYRFFQYRNQFSHEDVARMVQIDYTTGRWSSLPPSRRKMGMNGPWARSASGRMRIISIVSLR